MELFNNLSDILADSNNILIPLHIGPDGDCIGSALAMENYLKNLGKNVHVVSYNKLPDYVKKLVDTTSVSESVSPESLDFSNYDLLLGLDLNEENLISQSRDFSYPSDFKKINIDHHEKNTNWGDLNIVINECSSTSNIIFRYFTFLDIEWDPVISTNIAMGILTDTGFFKNIDTKAEDFYAVGFLTENGFDNLKFVQAFSLETFVEKKFKGLVYTNLQIDKNLRCAYSYAGYDDRDKYGINKSVGLPKASSFIRNIDGIDFAFFVKEKSDNYYTISFRSTNENYDVAKIAEKLGGGGHKQAAGAVVKGISDIQEVIEKVLLIAKEVLEE